MRSSHLSYSPKPQSIIASLPGKGKSGLLDLPIAFSNGIIASMNKGYAFGFLIVLLVVVLGVYVALTGFMSSREAIQAQPTSASSTGAVQATNPPTSPLPTATATLIVIPTPVPGLTATLTAMVPTQVAEGPPPTNPPAPSPTNPPPAQPTNTPTPIVQPPTPVPIPAYSFRLAGPPAADPNHPSCCYLFGIVRDANGNGLEGVRVQAQNEWNTLPPALSKGGNELGQYNIPIGNDAVTWDLVIVDAAGNQISTKVQVQFDPSVANGFRIDWQRTY
jgi:hypothetical protein